MKIAHWPLGLSRGSAARIVLYAVVAVVAAVLGILWSGFAAGSISFPDVPQSVHLYVSGNAQQAMLDATIDPRSNCGDGSDLCPRAKETLTVDVTPQPDHDADWMLVVQGAEPLNRKGWQKAWLDEEQGPRQRVEVYRPKGDPTTPYVVHSTVVVTSSGADRLDATLPTLMDQSMGASAAWCARRSAGGRPTIEAGFEVGTLKCPRWRVEGLQKSLAHHPWRPSHPSHPTHYITRVPIDYITPSNVSVSEQFGISTRVLSKYPFTTAGDDASPTSNGWVWNSPSSSDPQVAPQLGAVDLQAQTADDRDKFYGALAFGVAATAVVGIVAEIEWKRRRKVKDEAAEWDI